MTFGFAFVMLGLRAYWHDTCSKWAWYSGQGDYRVTASSANGGPSRGVQGKPSIWIFSCKASEASGCSSWAAVGDQLGAAMASPFWHDDSLTNSGFVLVLVYINMNWEKLLVFVVGIIQYKWILSWDLLNIVNLSFFH